MKTFSLEEANALVPQISQLLDELLETRQQIIEGRPNLETVLRHAGGNGGNKASGEYVLLLQRFNTALGMLQDYGCELKDLDQGLVDFPSYREGQLVYLCWKRGEPRISFWHDVESGFGGRQPL